jgi:hypothetical protein
MLLLGLGLGLARLAGVRRKLLAQRGHVVMPHGFGLVYNGRKYGANVNRLTKNTHRDQFGTPIHRYVPCRVEAL